MIHRVRGEEIHWCDPDTVEVLYVVKPGLNRTGRAAVILSGHNIDRSWMQTVLAGNTPQAR